MSELIVGPAGARRWRRIAAAAASAALLAVVLHPLFLMLFRLMIFNTFPRDDYASILQWWLGVPGGVPPESPYGYRALSVLAAAPFYHLLPEPDLTRMPRGLATEYVKATLALAAVSYAALVASCVAAYRLVIDRFGLGRPEGVFAAGFILLAQLYASPFSVDPLAIFVVLLALYVIERRALFAAILIASVIVNEKIAILFAVWLTIRCVLGSWAALGRQWFASIAAILAYATLLAVVRLPGHGEQLDPGAYFPTLIQNTVASVTTLRGLVFNIVPCALLIGAVAWSWRMLGWQRHPVYSRLDLLVIPALAGVALVLTQYFQVGRIVAHAAPLFVWPLACAFGLWGRRGGSFVGA